MSECKSQNETIFSFLQTHHKENTAVQLQLKTIARGEAQPYSTISSKWDGPSPRSWMDGPIPCAKALLGSSSMACSSVLTHTNHKDTCLPLPIDAEQAHCETRAKIMTQNRSSESQNDHQWAKREDSPKANPCNELPRLSAASKVNLSLLGINRGGYYPFPSLARISASLICPTLVITDIPLNLTRIMVALSLHWSSREDAILNQGASQSSSWWAAEPPREEAHGDALTTEYSFLN